jgi:hypothetical protein
LSSREKVEAIVSKLDEQVASRSRDDIHSRDFAIPESEESIVSKLDEQVDPGSGMAFRGAKGDAKESCFAQSSAILASSCKMIWRAGKLGCG